MSERKQEISAAKNITEKNEAVIGNYREGAVIKDISGNMYALKHSMYRFTENNGHKPGDYTASDLLPISYRINPIPTREETTETVSSWLDKLKNGEIPEHKTVGIEVEATCYDKNGNTETPYSEKFRPVDSMHPELLAFTLETATKENGNGLARNATEVSYALAEAILKGYEIAATKNLQLNYSSVAESGEGEGAQITPHPYLLSFAPSVINFTLENSDKIPGEVLRLYEKAGVDVLEQMRKGVLNWPVNALHVHTGVPQKDGLVDTRAAHASGLLKLSGFSKAISFTLYNTRHLYGKDLGIKDVRSIARRLVASSHNGNIPSETETLIKDSVRQLEEGKIHSLPRYPDTGQHDRVRFRMDGSKKTVESIDAAMCPDLRNVLSWAYFNQISDVIALDTLKEVRGNVPDVIPYLKNKWGNIFSTIPTMGPGSSYEQDLKFNIEGYNSKSPNGVTIREQLLSVKEIISQYADKYPAIRLQSEVVCHTIDMQTENPKNGVLLTDYLGIEGGTYVANGLNRGLITDYKNMDPKELVNIQSEATKLQADSLINVKDEKDLREFMGIQKL